MSLYIGQLYHWTPKINRLSILREGLQVMRGNRMIAISQGTNDLKNPNGSPFYGFPWLCLGTTPSSAWALILDPHQDGAEGEGGWDLWQATLRETDKVAVRSDFDVPYIREVRVHHGLPPDRLWWVGERGIFPHESIGDSASPPPEMNFPEEQELP